MRIRVSDRKLKRSLVELQDYHLLFDVCNIKTQKQEDKQGAFAFIKLKDIVKWYASYSLSYIQ